MIRLFFKDASDERIAGALEAKGPKLLEVIAQKMNALMIKLQAHVVADKLSGQVLQHRTGKLASSIRVVPASTEGSVVTGLVQGGGGPAFYGKFQEYGTTRSYKIYPINKAALAFLLNGKQVIVKSVLHPPIKERSFMRTSLADQREEIIAGLRAGVAEALNE